MNYAKALALLFFATANASAQQFSNVPFDASSERVPPGYRAHDPEALIKALGQLPLAKPKGEFETTQQFEERLAKARQQTLLGKLKVGDTVAIFLSPDQFTSSYNADTGSLTVSSLLLPWSVADRRLKGAVVASRGKDVGTYVGVNAFNRKVQVTKRRVTESSVVFDFSDSMASIAEHIDIPPELARDAKANLGVLMVGSLDPPFVVNDTAAAGATIDSPVDLLVLKTGLQIKLESIVIVNRRTGEILKKGMVCAGFCK